jgi:hypothetical protein
LHLTEGDTLRRIETRRQTGTSAKILRSRGSDPNSEIVIQGQFPYCDEQGLHVAPDCWISGDIGVAWEFRIGGHQVCRKWLRERRGRTLSREELEEFLGIISVLQDTAEAVKEIDRAISQHGGWPAAFVGRDEVTK